MSLGSYLTFFGLGEGPFALTPDPRFLYMGPGHREALARLSYGTEERTGLIVLTGEVGTGKTTLLQALRERLEARAAVSYVFSSSLSFDGILEYVLHDLGVAKEAMSPARRLLELNSFLVDRARIGQNTVLILDEAQNLDASTLEQIGLLSNFENDRSKLLQIVLVGQPELNATLELPELRQLRQRIGLRCHIPPLDRQEVHQYIRNRLQVAGAPDLALFTDAAVDRITAYSGGIPRVINNLADHSLLLAYADQTHRIDRPTVDGAIRSLEEGAKSSGRDGRGTRVARVLGRLRWVPGTVGVALASAVAGFVLSADASLRYVRQALKDLLSIP